jgi:crossover junction endonuclease MUS81
MREHAEQRDGRHYHISFAAFNELNSKSRNLLLRDAYVKQLLCIRGVSVEKAVVIATKYPTLRRWAIRLAFPI